MHYFPSRGKVKRTKLQGLSKTGISRGMLGAAWGWAAFLTIASCRAKMIDWTLEAVEMSKKWKGLKAGYIHFTLSSSSYSFCVYFEIVSMLCSSEIPLYFSILVSRLRFTVNQSFLSLSVSGALIVEYFYQRDLKSHSTLVQWGIFWEGENTNSLLKGIRWHIGPMFKPTTLQLTWYSN